MAVSKLNQDNSQFSEGFLVLVRHPEDKDCEEVVNKYKSLLKENNRTFYDLPLDVLLSVHEKIDVLDDVREWLGKFRERYF